MSKTLNKGDGMNRAHQDAAMGKRPRLRASFRLDGESWLPSALPVSLQLDEGHPRRHSPAQEQPSSCPEQRTMGQPMVSRQDRRPLESLWLSKVMTVVLGVCGCLLVTVK